MPGVWSPDRALEDRRPFHLFLPPLSALSFCSESLVSRTAARRDSAVSDSRQADQAGRPAEEVEVLGRATDATCGRTDDGSYSEIFTISPENFAKYGSFLPCTTLVLVR